MTRYLLDTTIVSDGLRPRPDPRIAEWLGAVRSSASFLSAMTLGELRHGIALLPSGSDRRESLTQWLDDDLLVRFRGRILPFDLAAALAWGDLFGEARAKGVTLPIIDSQIAAIAKVNDLTLVTRNTRHFEQCGISVIDPWS